MHCGDTSEELRREETLCENIPIDELKQLEGEKRKDGITEESLHMSYGRKKENNLLPK